MIDCQEKLFHSKTAVCGQGCPQTFVHIVSLSPPRLLPLSPSPLVRVCRVQAQLFNSPRRILQSAFLLPICVFVRECVVEEGRRRASSNYNEAEKRKKEEEEEERERKRRKWLLSNFKGSFIIINH